MNRADKVKELLLKTYRQGSDSAGDKMDERILGEASTTMKQALATGQSNGRVCLENFHETSNFET